MCEAGGALPGFAVVGFGTPATGAVDSVFFGVMLGVCADGAGLVITYRR
jgi:hypothetical protein